MPSGKIKKEIMSIKNSSLSIINLTPARLLLGWMIKKVKTMLQLAISYYKYLTITLTLRNITFGSKQNDKKKKRNN